MDRIRTIVERGPPPDALATIPIMAGGQGEPTGDWSAGLVRFAQKGHVMSAIFGILAFSFVLIGLMVALMVTLVSLVPLVVVVGGGFLLFRLMSGHSPRLRSMSWRGHGPGRMAAPVEQGIFCPACNELVSRQWATCPHCGYRKYVAPDLIQRRCSTCGTELQKDWHACPYCSTRVDAPLMAPAPGPAVAPPPAVATVYPTGTSV